MKNNKILRYFLYGLLLLFVIHQAYSLIYKPISTESAEYCEVIDGVSVRGLVVREESVITNAAPGVLHFEVTDGERVSNDGVIAEVYDSASTSHAISRMNEIIGQINDIEELQGYNNVIASDLSVADAKVNEALGALIMSCRGGNLSESSGLTLKLTAAMSRRQMITGEQTDFSARLAALKAELDGISAGLPAASGYVRAPMSGYFLSHVDGYEQALSGKTAEELTPELLSGISPENVPADAVGKIVSGYEWLIAAKISTADLQRFSVGDEFTVHTPVNGGSDLSVTVRAINMSENREEAAIVLSCGSVSRELASLRFGNFTIINRIYRGLKVAESALRKVNDETGVYILNGSMVKFVPVNVIYALDDYIICEKKDSNDNVLRLYDDVVVKGKKLYDGKVVR